MDIYDVNKLRDIHIFEIFKQQLHETMNGFNINQEKTIDTKWKIVEGTIKTVKDAVIGKQKRIGVGWWRSVVTLVVTLLVASSF